MNAPGPRPALLLLGPTGAGKSPLGDLLERRGLAGRPCAHFDFGRELRRAAADAEFARARGLADADRAAIRAVLASGALLERDTFHIALRLLDGFAAERGPAGAALLVLNGLPRHVEQAAGLVSRVRVETIVRLEAGAETLLERIRRDAGGDRGGRADDGPDAVRRRIAAYRARTEPLAAHYAALGAAVRTLEVGPATTAEWAWTRLGAGGG